MATSSYESILQKLDSSGVDYELLEHEPVYTSKQAAELRGTNLHQGAKAMVLDWDGRIILYVLPGDLDVDFGRLKGFLGGRKLAMASRDTVKARTGLEVGSIPPFGSVIGLSTYVDSRLSDNDEIVFNVARHDRSVQMKYLDFLALEKPQVVILK